MTDGLDKMGKSMDSVGNQVSSVSEGVSKISISSLGSLFSFPKLPSFSMPKISFGWGFGKKK